MSTAAAPTRTGIRPGEVLADLLPASRVRDTASSSAAPPSPASPPRSPPVPGSPVPVTGQTFAALLVGTALGTRRGFLSLAVYALVGMAGVPWFAGGGSGTAAPSFGYILGMLLAATVVGALARRGADRSVLRTAGTMLLGEAIIYAIGVPYLALATGMSASAAIAAGLTPFLIGDALKAALAMGVLPTAWKFLNR